MFKPQHASSVVIATNSPWLERPAKAKPHPFSSIFPRKAMHLTYPQLKFVRVRGVRLIRAHYSPSFTPFRAHLDYLSSTNVVLYPMFKDKYERLPKDTLRWIFMVHRSTKTLRKPVQRERVQRRCREAFRQALRENGYDDHGAIFEGGKALRPLRGTLELEPDPKCLVEPFPELIRQSSMLLTALKTYGGTRALGDRQVSGPSSGQVP